MTDVWVLKQQMPTLLCAVFPFCAGKKKREREKQNKRKKTIKDIQDKSLDFVDVCYASRQLGVDQCSSQCNLINII